MLSDHIQIPSSELHSSEVPSSLVPCAGISRELEARIARQGDGDSRVYPRDLGPSNLKRWTLLSNPLNRAGMTSDQNEPQFTGPIVQWPKYGAVYCEQQFVIGPVPTDDGRWLLAINEWSDPNRFYPTVIAAIDAALSIIKETVDQESSAGSPESTAVGTSEELGSEEVGIQ
jgi:hypothetical protein